METMRNSIRRSLEDVVCHTRPAIELVFDLSLVRNRVSGSTETWTPIKFRDASHKISAAETGFQPRFELCTRSTNIIAELRHNLQSH